MQGRLRESAVVEPTAVQQAAIPAILSGRNVAMQCYTGSGKVQTLVQSRLFVSLLLMSIGDYSVYSPMQYKQSASAHLTYILLCSSPAHLLTLY